MDIERQVSPPAVSAPPRSLAERLFTPENVRILQSLGIGMIFISAVALVRNQMWGGASIFERLGMLMGGTLLCYAIGGCLYRWSQLRITGLGFLILGHLAILLDAYAALVLTTPDHPPLYPFAPESLWTLTFIVFTATATWHARKLKEPLFDAFTVFGALAAWASAALWCNIDPELIPAAFVPALFIAGAVAHALQSKGELVRRWSLIWWLRSTFECGSQLLVAVLPAVAIYAAQYAVPNNCSQPAFDFTSHIVIFATPRFTTSGQNQLAVNFVWHALAMVALAASLLARPKTSPRAAPHCAAFLALLITPLAAYAFGWSWEAWAAALALPGAALVLAAVATQKLLSLVETKQENASPRSIDSTCRTLADWGIGAAIAGATWAMCAYANGCSPLTALWPALGALIATLVYADRYAAPWSAWVATSAAAVVAILLGDQLNLSTVLARHDVGADVAHSSWPFAWLIAALGLHIFWAIMTRVRRFSAAPAAKEVPQHGRWAADALAGVAIVRLLLLSGALLGAPTVAIAAAVGCGWAAAAVFALATAFLTAQPFRRSLGLALLSPGCVYAMYSAGFKFGEPAPWLAGLALVVLGIEAWISHARRDSASDAGALVSVGTLAAHALILACWQSIHGATLSAALAFSILAAAAFGLSILFRRHRLNAATAPECATLLFFLAAAVNLCSFFGVCSLAWPMALVLLAAVVWLLAVAAECLATSLAPRSNAENDVRPFEVAGQLVVAILSLLALLQLSVIYNYPGIARAWAITTAWCGGLLPAFLAVRGWLPARSGSGARKESDTDKFLSLLGSLISALFFALAALNTLCAGFWTLACPHELRAACALFFGAALVLSGLAGFGFRRAFSPITGTLAALGLIGCAYGAWNLPVESFGLICAVLSAGLGLLAGRIRRCEELLKSGLLWATQLSAGSVALTAALFMLGGLIAWPIGPMHAFAVAGWGLLAMMLWRGSSEKSTRGRALLTAIATGFAGCHALRWSGLEFAQFGPALSALALLMLVAREAVRRVESDGEESDAQLPPAAAGLLWAALLLGVAGFSFGVLGLCAGWQWLWCATLAESALLLAAFAVLVRRDYGVLDARGLGLELLGWLLLVMSVQVAAGLLLVPITGAMWALLGAILIALGMAGESAAGGLLGAERHFRIPTPFLESRNIVAAVLGLLGVLRALSVHAPLLHPAITDTWSALFGAAALAIYLSIAGWSNARGWNIACRWGASFAAYVLLLPGGYLCLLKALSTGSSWGSLWFMLLIPVLFGAVHILEREKLHDQAAMAKLGIFIVNLGAAILAFVGNRADLAAVPALTFAAMAAQAFVARRATGQREFTSAACLAVIASAFYGIRALVGYPAWGGFESWVWEMPAMSLFGLAMIAFGGVLKIDEDTSGRSIVGKFGAALAAAAPLGALWLIMSRGLQVCADASVTRLDALIASLMLLAGAATAARKWLGFEAAKYVAPAATLAGYALFILREPVSAWEWVFLPGALLLFLWARQQATDEHAQSAEWEVNVSLALASALALVPSFIQALPYDNTGMLHTLALLAIAFGLVIGAMLARRKIPLMAGSSAILLITLAKALEWARHQEVLWPVLGIGLGFAIVALGSFFEAHMNRLIREAVDRAKAEARMFWVSWQ